jgi:hypothetical protein
VIDQPPARRGQSIAVDGALVVSLTVVIVSWFTASLLKPRATAALAVLSLLVLIASRRRAVLAFRPRLSTVIVCGLGLLLRAPALVEPAGFVGADGSLQAILTHGILDGVRPAPAFLETSSYQGSLKAHIGALASLVVGRDDLARLVVIGSVVLWTMFTAGIMALGRRLGGSVPAIVAGLFVALSPRFATIFSVSNVGEYPDALGLGTWAMAWAAAVVAEERSGYEARGSFFGIGLLLGIALWQQPISASFALVALGLLGARALWRRDPWFLAAFLGLFLGRLPVTIHDAAEASSNAAVVGGFVRSAGQSLSLGEHVRGTLEWAFPITLAGLSNDTPFDARGRIAIGLACAGLVLVFLLRAAFELRAAVVSRSWVMVRVMGGVNFLAALAFVWLVAGGGQYVRPRYFLPLLAGFALAMGDVTGALWRRSRVAALALAALVIGWNALSNVDRLQSGLEDGRRLQALARRIEQLELKTGYAGVAIAGPLIMLTNERVSVDGVLGSAVGQRLPARHIDRVRRYGPDFYLAEEGEAPRLARRFGELGVRYQTEGTSPVLFYGLSRRVPLFEVQE